MENHRWNGSGSDGGRNGYEFQGPPPLHSYQHDVMHELSIALNIVEIAEEELARHGGERVRAVHLQVGPLAGVAKEALLFSFGLASEGAPVVGSRLIIEDTQGRVLDIVRLEIV